jgi:hypothetical protein
MNAYSEFYCLCDQTKECRELREITRQLTPEGHAWVRKDCINFTKKVSLEIGVAFRLRLREMWGCSLVAQNYIAPHHFLECHLNYKKNWRPVCLDEKEAEQSDSQLRVMNLTPQFATDDNFILTILSKGGVHVDPEKEEKLRARRVAMPMKSLDYVKYRHAEWRAAMRGVINFPISANSVEFGNLPVPVEALAIDVVVVGTPAPMAVVAAATTSTAIVPTEDTEDSPATSTVSMAPVEAYPCTLDAVWDERCQQTRKMSTLHLYVSWCTKCPGFILILPLFHAQGLFLAMQT